MTLPPAERAQNPQSDVEWLHEQILDFQATSNTHQISLDKHYRGLAMVLEAQAAEIASRDEAFLKLAGENKNRRHTNEKLERELSASRAEIATARLAMKALDGYRRSAETYDELEDQLATSRAENAALAKLVDEAIGHEWTTPRDTAKFVSQFIRKAKALRAGQQKG